MINSAENLKLLFLSDTHLGFDYPIRPKIKRRRRGPDFFNNFVKILNYAVEEKVDIILHGGDLFFRSKIPNVIVDKVYQILFSYAEKVKFVIVPGNHERSRLPESILLEHPNIYVFREPQTFSFRIKNFKINISGFPYYKENLKEDFPRIIENTDYAAKSDINLLCIHHAIYGAQVGPSNFTFRYGKDVVQMNDIPQSFDAVLSGHIHRQQILFRECSNTKKIPVIFAGSTERTSFAEKNETKGFYRLTYSKKNDDKINQKITFHPLITREMIDIKLSNNLDFNKLDQYIKLKLDLLPEDAIVRISADKNVKNDQLKKISTKKIREIIPETMNLEISRSLFRK